ncbi:FadR/GntR family transcriptional regulator [Litorivicinus lipolyticus]|uniref:FadR/GntR family transcriptional regulator n=1 Tax=Litorivicinus lipolyticus TaxID=418701 RepID=UPI003B5A58E1
MSESLFYKLHGSTTTKASFSSQIAREIGRDIVSAVLAEGSVMPDEGALAAQYDVSRTVIRDAVKLLSTKGLLDVRRGNGTHVRARSNWDLLDHDVLAWHQSAPVNPQFLKELLQLRLMVEPAGAYYAAELGSDESHREIARAFSAMQTEQGDIERFVTADALYHRAILRSTNNTLLRSMEGVIYSALLISIRLTNTDPRENELSLPFHQAVSDAIQARDSCGAEQSMRLMLIDTQNRLSKYMSDTHGQSNT